MIIVLDASSAIEMALNRENSDSYREILRESDLVIAPDVFPSEITNAFWKYASFSEMPTEQCKKGINYCIDLIDDFIETKSMCVEVFSESVHNEHSAYDVFYLVIARRYNASILSRDKKLKKIAENLRIGVINQET